MPQFSLISAVYNVEQYLPDFLRSLDEQTCDHSAVQVVLVDDGSTDSSAEIIDAWAATTDYSVEVIHQANAGQAAARNTGLDHASGSWVSFPDPDDILEPDYLSSVHRHLTTSEDVSMVATHLFDFWEAKDQIRDTHPLRFRFRGGPQVVDLDRFPRFIHLHASSAFFDRERVESFGIRFDPRIRPVFEDAHFVQSYLLGSRSRLVAFDSDAKYLYRRRADGSSTLQTSGTDARRYTDVLRYGLLDLLERAQAAGNVPRWLQNTVLYDLLWILRSEESLTPKTGHLSAATADEFCELLARIRTLIESETIEAFDIIRMSQTQREVLLHGIAADDWSWDFIHAERFDERKKLIKLRYRFSGAQPTENLRFRGLDVEPMYAKTRSIKYLGRPLLFERILWVSARGTITAQLRGRDVPISRTLPAQKEFTLRPARLEHNVPANQSAKRPAKRRRTTVSDRLVTKAADSILRRKFASAWVFMDRPDRAGDNAEHLFKHVRAEHKDRNAWFVVDRGSRDWKRLKSEGIDHLVAHGSREWKALCLNAELIISSHIDADVITPFTLSNGRKPTWDHVFLQHGVTMNDLSAWINTKQPRLVVTSTEPEHRSLAGDGSPYLLSDKDTAMTGMPRYDRLSRLDTAAGESRATTITVMPTWRKEIDDALNAIDSPELRAERFLTSDWWRAWSAVLNSPTLREVSKRHGMTIRFIPHPRFEPYVRDGVINSTVEVARLSERDFQTLLVESSVLVTDLSSVAFDAAFIDRPVVYFQFDSHALYGGGHTTKPGYFSFAEDGFGPVVSTCDEVIGAIDSLLAGDHPDLVEFARRRASTFTLPKTENCERTYRAIARSLKVVSPKDGTSLVQSLRSQPTRYLEPRTPEPEASPTH
ncbi:bifunctional glycosyltransferase/CDP-glycerol:glycerophosphate glycerophosphotransferase [Brevibacterium casei]|uniref:CDP-glycerol glycerophosphotransferase family protein n=1 Tax=Brevibacterium casei TaxID=33889 RepID=A0A7T4A0T1_9MICO|nr:glycosyltransferase [Brevibacterium casei]QQB15175.1 CDP-glycerol glycerophosphotransferase family protein [Brevibacterium casei]